MPSMNGTRSSRSEFIADKSICCELTKIRKIRLNSVQPTTICNRFSPVAAMNTQKKKSANKSHGAV